MSVLGFSPTSDGTAVTLSDETHGISNALIFLYLPVILLTPNNALQTAEVYLRFRSSVWDTLSGLLFHA